MFKTIEINKSQLINNYLTRQNIKESNYKLFILIMQEHCLINNDRGVLEINGLSCSNPNLRDLANEIIKPAIVSSSDVKAIKSYLPETIESATLLQNRCRIRYTVVDE